MKLSDLGERKIIEIFMKNLGKCEKSVVGIGDDACVLDIGLDDRYLVISTDLITKKTHIPREMTTRQIGNYIVNVNLSDIAAMGARPLGLVFSLGLPGEFDKGFIEELIKGINSACREHDACILGGDTKEQREIVISGTALGLVDKDKVLTRGGAKAGDYICVTGTIGLAPAGFYALIKGLTIDKKIKDKLVKAAVEPRARVKEGILLGNYANACMDVTDGLAYSLYEISRVSKTGFLVYEDKIPVEKEVKAVSEMLNIDEKEIVFHKGGDYELLFTLNPENFSEMKEEMRKIGTKVRVIGEVTKERSGILDTHGKKEPLESRGYEAFLSRF